MGLFLMILALNFGAKKLPNRGNRLTILLLVQSYIEEGQTQNNKTVMCVSFYRIAIFVSIKQQLLGRQ